MVGAMSAPKILTFETELEFQDAAAAYLRDRLKRATNTNARTTLYLSGGSTPGPIYSRLSTEQLAWSKISIAQVDDRWVGLDDPGSNATLIKKTILKNKAAKAVFVRIKSHHRSAAAGQERVNESYKSLIMKNSVAVLGMGMDGHVCSWFPNSNGIEAALDPANDNIVEAILAKRSKVTGPYLERMTLTLRALKQCGSVLLLIKGEDKKELLQNAIHSRPDHLPVTHLLNAIGKRLTIMCAG